MRNRSKPHSFKDLAAQETARLRERAKALPPGLEKDALLKKIRQIDTASHIGEWLSSPGLRPPT
jgi:hypothetical protein